MRRLILLLAVMAVALVVASGVALAATDVVGEGVLAWVGAFLKAE
jgi:hypothetical protein